MYSLSLYHQKLVCEKQLPHVQQTYWGCSFYFRTSNERCRSRLDLRCLHVGIGERIRSWMHVHSTHWCNIWFWHYSYIQITNAQQKWKLVWCMLQLVSYRDLMHPHMWAGHETTCNMAYVNSTYCCDGSLDLRCLHVKELSHGCT